MWLPAISHRNSISAILIYSVFDCLVSAALGTAANGYACKTAQKEIQFRNAGLK